MNSIRDANIAKRNKDFIKAEEIYTEIYKDDPTKFRFKSLQNYAYVLYENHIKNGDDSDFMKYAEFITTITSQLKNGHDFCVYTVTVIATMEYLNENKEYGETIKWFSKLNPKLISIKSHRFDNGIVMISDREKFYYHFTKALFNVKLYPECIKFSKEALENGHKMVNRHLFKWNIVKSYYEEGEYDEALVYLKEIEYLNYWYYNHKFAQIYYEKDDIDMALKYALKAALDDEPPTRKFNLYKTIIRILMKKGLDEEILRHEYLIYSVNKQFYGHNYIQDTLREEFIDSGFDIENVDAYKTEAELKQYWANISSSYF